MHRRRSRLRPHRRCRSCCAATLRAQRLRGPRGCVLSGSCSRQPCPWRSIGTTLEVGRSTTRGPQKSSDDSSGIQPSRCVRPPSCQRSRRASRSVADGSTTRSGRHRLVEIVHATEHSDAEPGDEGGTDRGRIRRSARPRSVGPWRRRTACTNVGFSLIPPSMRTDVMSTPVSASAASSEIGAAMGDALQHGPHDVRPLGAPRDAEQRTPRAVVPVRRAEAEQRRHVHHPVGCRWHALGDVVALLARRDQAEVVAQPFDVRAGGEHDPLDPPRQIAIARPQGQRDRCRAGIRLVPRGRTVVGAEVEHPAGAERDLRPAAHHAVLADERRLLIAEDAGDRAVLRAARWPRRTRRPNRRPSGSTDRGMPNASSTSSFQSRPVDEPQPARRGRGVRLVTDVERPARAPPDRVHAIQLSTVPMQTSAPGEVAAVGEQPGRPW